MRHYDVIVIGGGLSGLTAASLLAKRGLRVAVVEKSQNPGGSCGVFKRGKVTFDNGAAMLYGFGPEGFNAHRFVFNCLEEPIDVIKHELLYCVNFKGQRIRFWPDVEKFAEELSGVFPSERENIHRFYSDMLTIYRHVMVETPTYTTADETDRQAALKSMLKHPVSYIRFLTLLNKSAETLLKRYFKDPEIFKFFDKLTSTYCYTTVAESPAVLAAVMFVDNHVGGSFYPAGSTLFLPGKLEKVIEENGGDMLLGSQADSIIFDNGRPSGVLLADGRTVTAEDIVFSGTVWNLYGRLLDPAYTTPQRRAWAKSQAPTYPSVVLYSVVRRDVIPEDTAPVEMLVGNPDGLDESEVTAYILSVDDRTLCGPEEHTVLAIGPTFENWETAGEHAYREMKARELDRLIAVLEKRFPGFGQGVLYAEVATPRTIERYTMKNGGAVAGPKQALGQHMFKRLHTRTEWDNLFCCGESTVMGTGTPTVTTSGLAAANAVLSKRGLMPYKHDAARKNYVRIIDHPTTAGSLYAEMPEPERSVMLKALRCRFCEHPACRKAGRADIRGIMRRAAVGNFAGALKRLSETATETDDLELYEQNCICAAEEGSAVAIRDVVSYISR
jgi:prolycopene isomerase